MRTKATSASIAFIFIAFGASLPCSFGRSVASSWQGVETSRFTIYSANQDPGAQAILARLETARSFFAQAGLTTPGTTSALAILAVDATADADVYRLNPAAYAFYQRTPHGDFVVMHDLAPEHFSVAVHEYTHFVIEHAGLKLPLWLNEGVADFYSTLEARKTQVVIGIAPIGREDRLRAGHWIDWTTLTAVDNESPYYRQSDKMILFYAQSWAMVHMLALDPEYAAGFPKFLETVSSGVTVDAAMIAIYHKNLQQIGEDLQSYVGSKRMTTHVLDIDVRLPALATTEIADAGARVEFALAEILSANPPMIEEATRRLTALATKYQQDPRADESLGFIAMRAGLAQDAAAHFARALQNHSQDPEVWFRLAHLKLQTGGPTPEVVDLLERVTAINADNYAARLELGFAAAKIEKYDLAVKTLEGISKVKPEHAYLVTYTLAYCLIHMEQGNRARTYAEQASKIAPTNKDRNEAANLLSYIDKATPVEVAARD